MRGLTLLLVLTVVAGAPAIAQRPQQPGVRPQRALLEQRFRNRLRDVMKQRLDLNEAQVDRLTDVNQRFETRRRELLLEEREVRQSMRRALAPNASASADQDAVAGLLDRALRVQRQRLDLIETEQRELATFLSPVQRARYFGLQEQLRRQVEEMRERPPARRRPAGRQPF
jgi:periplasmic protein CpxP/Spy